MPRYIKIVLCSGFFCALTYLIHANWDDDGMFVNLIAIMTLFGLLWHLASLSFPVKEAVLPPPPPPPKDPAIQEMWRRELLRKRIFKALVDPLTTEDMISELWKEARNSDETFFARHRPDSSEEYEQQSLERIVRDHLWKNFADQFNPVHDGTPPESL